jgi:hypothetical protein
MKSDERPLFAVAAFMNGAGKRLGSASGFALDQDRNE